MIVFFWSPNINDEALGIFLYFIEKTLGGKVVNHVEWKYLNISICGEIV